MIAEYEGPHDHEVDAPRIYALGQTHKHLPEIKKYTGLASLPIFLPIVAPYYSGMLVTVGIENRDHQRLEDIRQGYREFFGPSPFISVAGEEENPVMLGSNTLQERIPCVFIFVGTWTGSLYRLSLTISGKVPAERPWRA